MLPTQCFHDVDQSATCCSFGPCAHEKPATIMDQVPRVTTRELRAKEHIFFEGDHKTHVYLVESGAVSIYKVLVDGSRQIIDFALPGDVIGLGSNSEHINSAQSTVATRLQRVSFDVLQRQAQKNPQLAMQLYAALSEELAAARDLLVTVGQRSASQRVVAFLLALSRRNRRYGKDPSDIVLPMTRSDIADFLGLTIETVSRTFSSLKSKGLIVLGRNAQVDLTDLEALERLCAEQ